MAEPIAQSPFDHLPHTARGHFLLHFYTAVYRVLNYCQRLNAAGGDVDQLLTAYPFLMGYASELGRHVPPGSSWQAALQWWEAEVLTWEAACPASLPLMALAADGLPLASRTALLIIGLVEEDSRFGTLFADLQAPLPHRRPSLELVGRMLLDDNLSHNDSWHVCRPLLASGLVEVANRDLPRSEWLLRVPSLLWDVVRGDADAHAAPWLRHYEAAHFAAIKDLILPADFAARLEQVPALITSGKARAMVVRGMRGSERVEIAGALARALDRGVVLVEGVALANEQYRALLGPFCTMTHALPLLTYDLGPGEVAEPPELNGYSGPVGLILGFEGGLNGPVAEQAVALVVPATRGEQRVRHWQAALAGRPVEGLAEIGARFQLPGGYIKRAAGAAIAQAALDRRDHVTAGDIRAACRTLNRQMLDTLAVRLEGDGTWEQLVVSDAAMAKLRELEQRCHHRENLLDYLGPAFGPAHNRGVRALFTGPSGTGKTLAAKILAASLGMDLYRVDLAAVVNKYIGETEKNLHQVLSRAEELDVMLLLDEGDSLLGSRTEVKTANDRYANLETNYLLQRLENYQGIILITTNAGERIDSAFQRRMDLVAHFLPPQAQERWQIWQIHLPARHAISEATLEEIAVRCILTGGQIRNAALHATLLALDDHAGLVTRRHVEDALRSEYRKAGAIYPLATPDQAAADGGGVEAFLDALSLV